jgi:hypothetical protein
MDCGLQSPRWSTSWEKQHRNVTVGYRWRRRPRPREAHHLRARSGRNRDERPVEVETPSSDRLESSSRVLRLGIAGGLAPNRGEVQGTPTFRGGESGDPFLGDRLGSTEDVQATAVSGPVEGVPDTLRTDDHPRVFRAIPTPTRTNPAATRPTSIQVIPEISHADSGPGLW